MSRFVELGESDNIDVDVSEIMSVRLPVATEKVTVKSSEQVQVVKPSEGKYFDEVVVDSVALDKPDQTKTTIPTKERQVVRADVGFELAENIVEPIPDEYNNTSDATAEAYDIARGKTAYTKNGLVEGTLVDRLQWKCDNIQSLQSAFQGYQGESLDNVFEGLDVSNVKLWHSTFSNCPNLTSIPVLRASNVTSLYYLFYLNALGGKLTHIDISGLEGSGSLYSAFENRNTLEYVKLSPNFKCTSANLAFKNTGLRTVEGFNASETTGLNSTFSYCQNLTGEMILDIPKCTDLTNSFQYCTHITSIKLTNSHNVTKWSSAFSQCVALVTLEADLYSASSIGTFMSGTSRMENLTLKNIRKAITIGSGTSYGRYLTDASLVNTAQELWDLTGSTRQTLTASTQSKNRFNAIYVKLVDITDEMRLADPYIDNKKPCEVCESTDDGAMTLREYIVSKNWSIA